MRTIRGGKINKSGDEACKNKLNLVYEHKNHRRCEKRIGCATVKVEKANVTRVATLAHRSGGFCLPVLDRF
jgi:hypothetical protein